MIDSADGPIAKRRTEITKHKSQITNLEASIVDLGGLLYPQGTGRASLHHNRGGRGLNPATEVRDAETW